ncbi:MAG: tetratricopeptide repeat protein [Paludibacteraceae bacterium]
MKLKSFIFIVCLLLIYPAEAQIKGKEIKPAAHQLTEDERARFDYYFFEAQRLKDIQKYDGQLEALRMCLEIDSINAAAQSEMGYLYARLNRESEATKAFKKAVEASPENWWYRTQYISLLSRRQLFDTAIEQAEELKKLYPQREEVYTMLSSLYKQTGEMDKAINALNQLEVYTGINEYLSLEKFQIYSQLKKDKKAIDEILKLIQKYPQESRYKVLLGDIYLGQKQTQKAYEIYQQVLKEDPNNPFAYVSLSNYYKLNKQNDKALESIVSAIKNPQLPSDTKMDILGQYVDQLLSDNQKISETENLFKMLIDMYPMEEMTHTYYAMFLNHQKRTAEAMEELESVININPKNEAAWKSSLQILTEKEDTVGILKLTERAIKVLPEVPEFYFYRSIAQYQQGKYQDALNTNFTALKNLSSAPGAVISNFYGQIADIYFQLKDKENAYKNYEKALEANPSNVFIMNNYAYYLSEEGLDLRKAERMSAKSVELEPNNSTYLDTYAWIFYKQGSYNLARIYIDKAVTNMKKDEESEVILEHSGDIYFALKENKKALEMWQKALELKKDDTELIKKINRVKNENVK